MLHRAHESMPVRVQQQLFDLCPGCSEEEREFSEDESEESDGEEEVMSPAQPPPKARCS